MNDGVWRQTDIARYLGVSKQRAHQLLVEGRLPAPEGEDHGGRYWTPSAIRAWARAWAEERPWRRLAKSTP